MNDESLKSLLKQLRMVVDHKGTVTVEGVSGLVVYGYPVYTDLCSPYLEGSSLGIPVDGRRRQYIEWVYNPRQITLSFMDLLHELGHFFSGHGVSGDDHEVLRDEIEAWDWARARWRLAPVRRRWDELYESVCLDSYFRNRDPFLTERFDVIEDIMYYGEKEISTKYGRKAA